MTIFDYNRAIEEMADADGVIADIETFDRLNMERAQKIENILMWIKSLKAESKAIREEEKALAERRKVAENKAENLSNFIQMVLDGEKFKTAKAAVTYRKSSAVNITDVYKIPEQFLRYKEPEADKVALKDALLVGAEIDGAELVEKISMQIK